MRDVESTIHSIRHNPLIKSPFFAYLLTICLSLLGLSGIGLFNHLYPLQLHTLFDILTIIATSGISLFMWNSRQWWRNNYLIVIAIAFQYVGFIATFHTLLRHDPSFTPYIHDDTVSLWSLGLLLQNSALLCAPLFIQKPLRIPRIFLAVSIVTVGSISALFWGGFDAYFMGNSYRTTIVATGSAYSLCVFAGAIILYKKRRFFEPGIVEILFAAYISALSGNIVAAMSRSPYDLPMSLGHSLRIVTLYLFYRVLVEMGLKKPYQILFHDLKLHQDQLRKEKEQLARYLDTADIIIVLIGPAGQIQLINRKGCKLLGCAPEQLLGKNWFDECIPERVREPLRSLFHRLIQGKINVKGIYKNPLLTKNGKERVIAWSNTVIYDENGGSSGVISSGIDITDRKKTYEKINLLASFPEMDPDPICEIDFKGRLTYANPALLSLFPDITEKNLSHAWFQDMGSQIIRLFKPQSATSLVRQIKIDDEYYEQHLHLVPTQSYIRIYGTNITQRKKAELILQRYQKLLKEEVLQSTDDLIETNKKLNAEIEERKRIEYELELKNELLRIAGTAVSTQDYLQNLIEIIRTISACPAVGIRIYEEGTILYHSYQGMDGAFWADENSAIAAGHQCLCLKGARTRADVPYVTAQGTFYCEDTRRFLEELPEMERTAVACRYILNGYRSFAAFRIQHAETLLGTLHCADTQKNPLLKQSLRLIESLVPLIGEGINKLILAEKMKMTQNKLNDARRLSDIGTLAAIVAHELRNPLAAMLIASYNLKRKLNNPHLDKHVITIEKKIAESDQIINNLLFYSHYKKAHFESVPIAKSIGECVATAKARFARYQITLKSAIEALRNCCIDADAVQIKELLGNIINNAFEALPNNTGTIRVEGSLRQQTVQIVIADTGIGINEEAIHKVYEPFFTTKSKGTGLGLSVCHQIVTLHHGTLTIQSKPAQGTTVTITLPIHQEQTALPDPAQHIS